MVIATELRRFAVVDPADGSVIDSLEAAGPDDGIAAVDAAAAIGREGGHHGLLEFLEPKYFAFD